MVEGYSMGLLEANDCSSNNSSFISEKHFLHSGISFDRISYSFSFSINKFEKSKLDLVAKSQYSGINIHPYHEIGTLNLSAISDSSKGDIIFDKFKNIGSGITIQKLPSETITTKDNNQIVISTKIQEKNIITFDQKISKESILQRHTKVANTCELTCTNPNLKYEMIMTNITKPIKQLEIEVHFPKEIFEPTKHFNIRPIYFLGNDQDYSNRTIEHLLNHIDDCIVKKIGPRSWKWTSSSPPLVGMKYGLTYNKEEVQSCLLEEYK